MRDELRARADHLHPPARGADPHRKRRPPVPIAGEGPIPERGQEITEPAPPYMFRMPVHLLILLDQFVLNLRGGDEPRVEGVVEKRGVTPPAERVVVVVGLLPKQAPALGEVLYDERVRVLHEHPGGEGELVGEPSPAIHRLKEGEPLLLAQVVILLPERGGDVDDPRPLVQGHERGRRYLVGIIVPRQTVQGRVVLVEKLVPWEDAEDVRLFPQHCRYPGRSEDQPFPPVHDLRVRGVGVDRHRHVRGERPRGRRPHQQGDIRVIREGHPHEHGGVSHPLVPLGHLVGGERCPAAGAVGQDLVALGEEAAGMDLPELPPQGLDVVIVVGDVGVFEVDPEPHAPDHLFPGPDVGPHRALALGDELLHPVALDLGLGADPKLLLHLELHGKAVAIPPRLPADVAAAHRVVAGEQVLLEPGEEVPDVGIAVGRGGAFVEHVPGAAHPLFE